MERYHFAPMLGQASHQAEGSSDWAECYGNELDYHVERLADEVDRFAGIIGKLVAADPPPWTILPKPPCRTADAFFSLVRWHDPGADCRCLGGVRPHRSGWYGPRSLTPASAISTRGPTDGDRKKPAWTMVGHDKMACGRGLHQCGRSGVRAEGSVDKEAAKAL